MTLSTTLHTTDIHQLELVHRGKVRDVYKVGLHDLLIVTCDRLSAFDVVMDDAVPDKGVILNELARFWFDKTSHIIPNHLTSLTATDVIGEHPQLELIDKRSVVVQSLKPLPFEAIVRGYIAGSGWKDYQRTQAVCGIHLPPGLEQAGRLPQPIFTPSTKAAAGHDENISMSELEPLVGRELAHKVRDISLHLYRFASEYARERGIIIADTKFEFGLNKSGEIIVMDEIFTPDSSRFWPTDGYTTGISPPSFDKQYVRDYLETLDWNKEPPPPPLPDEIVEQTRNRYIEAFERLTERPIGDIL